MKSKGISAFGRACGAGAIALCAVGARAQDVDVRRVWDWLRMEAAYDLIDEAATWNAAPLDHPVEFAQAEIFFEKNATDEDLGIHFALDGDAWYRVIILYPNFRRFIDVRAFGTERENGVTGLFSESAEPNFKTVPQRAFLRKFPEGRYILIGFRNEGGLLVSTAKLTHDLPDAPETLSPAKGAVVDPSEPLEIEWELTPDPRPGRSTIVGYQVIVTREEEGEPDRIIQIDMLADQTSVTIPPEFLEAGKDYKYEVLARETSGNQTITEVEFSTME